MIQDPQLGSSDMFSIWDDENKADVHNISYYYIFLLDSFILL